MYGITFADGFKVLEGILRFVSPTFVYVIHYSHRNNTGELTHSSLYCRMARASNTLRVYSSLFFFFFFLPSCAFPLKASRVRHYRIVEWAVARTKLDCCRYNLFLFYCCSCCWILSIKTYARMTLFITRLEDHWGVDSLHIYYEHDKLRVK